jgi:hypothetical protein
MMIKCGIHNANRQALDLAVPKNLATVMLTFVAAPRRAKEKGASLRPDRIV